METPETTTPKEVPNQHLADRQAGLVDEQGNKIEQPVAELETETEEPVVTDAIKTGAEETIHVDELETHVGGIKIEHEFDAVPETDSKPAEPVQQ